MWRRLCLWAVLASVGFAAICAPAVQPARATVQDDDICWDPDVEFPTVCDDGED